MDDRVQCYAIPYGAVGFVSHIVLYFSIVALALGRSPVMFWRQLAHKHVKNTLLIVSLLMTLVLTALSIARCHDTLALLLMAVGRLVVSQTLYYTAIHIVPVLRGCDANCLDTSAAVLYWLLLYAFGSTVGLAGLGQLVLQDFNSSERLRTGTFVFIALVCSIPTVALILSLQRAIRARQRLIRAEVVSDVESVGPHLRSEKEEDRKEKREEHSTLARAILFAIIAFLLSFGVLFAVQSDWALGIIAGDLSGAPPSDSAALYWTYFIFALLPFFSF